MKKIPEEAINEIKEILSRGCLYADTQEQIHETFLTALSEIGGSGDWDEMSTLDLDEREFVLQFLFEAFYDKIIEKVMNVLITQDLK